MRTLSSFAPHLGAALGAALMLAASLAFNAGAGDARAPAGAVEAAPEATGQDSVWAPIPASTPELDARAVSHPDPKAAPQAALLTAAPARPRLAVILDDVADMRALDRALALDAPVTVSILPYAQDAPALAAMARVAGREVFLHLPMEPVGLDDPGPHALTKALSSEATRDRLAWAFSQVPGAAGFNNHMGSRMTADRAAMDAVFAGLPAGAQDLIFVDSLTHPRSQAAGAARQAGLATLTRDVFLDHDDDLAAINAQLDTALALAVERGSAIVIAHPREATFEVLETLAARAQAAGVDLTSVAALSRP